MIPWQDCSNFAAVKPDCLESLKKNTAPVFLLTLVIFQIIGVGCTYFFQMIHYKNQQASTFLSKEKSTLWISTDYWQKHKDQPRKNEIIVNGIYYDIITVFFENELVRVEGKKDSHENIFIYIIDLLTEEKEDEKPSVKKNYWQFLFSVPPKYLSFYFLKIPRKKGVFLYKKEISNAFLQSVFRPPMDVFQH